MSNPLTVEEEAIQTILSRAQKGMDTYKVRLGDAPLHVEEVIQHAIEEALDLALYLIRLQREIGAAVSEIGCLNDTIAEALAGREP